MNQFHVVTVAAVEQLPHSRTGHPRWRLNLVSAIGTPMTIKTAPGVAASYSDRPQSDWAGHLMEVTFHATRVGNLIATDWRFIFPHARSTL